MNESTGGAQQIESEASAIAQGMEPGDVWLKKIAKAKEDEEAWRKEAEKAIAIYEGDKEALSKAGVKPISFNIYHSNVETMVPAVYNSTPVPDIRRRFDDPDPVSKIAVDTIERSLSYTIDQYEFDDTMRGAVRGALVQGRGVVRVRYTPHIKQQMDQATGQPVEVKGYEEVTCELVAWDRFIRGPARHWGEMPWIAFEHDLTRKQIADLVGEEQAEAVRLEGEQGSTKDKAAKPDAGIFKTAKVYEVWDKDSGLVFFIEDKKASEPLKVEQDPLGLPGFFPVPRPLQPIHRETCLTPVCPLTIYEPLILELDAVTKRISKLVNKLRVRGIYDAGLKADLQALMDADDGFYAPAEDAARFAQGAGGLEKAIAHFPMEPIVLALKELYGQREQIKQTIYEVTGLADIVRGASQASETATAQQIKAQYAGLRIQSLQKEVARVARDLFRMKAAIFCKHFSTENLQVMTGLNVQQAEQILRSEVMRSYRVDIETDSTIRGDVARSLEQMTQFITGTGHFVQAIGGMVQAAPPLLAPMMEVYASFARKFDLGKQAEDALDKMPQLIQQMLQAQQQQAQQPPPEQVKAQLDAKAREEEMAMKREMHGMDMQGKQAELQFQGQKMQMELASKEQAAMIDVQKAQMMPQRPQNGRAN